MKISIPHNHNTLVFDTEQAILMGLPVENSNRECFNLPPTHISPVIVGRWTGSVALGSNCNVDNLFISPHGNGTHTECCGHISLQHHTLKDSMTQYMLLAYLVQIQLPEDTTNYALKVSDLNWTDDALKLNISAIIISTNDYVDKRNAQYSNTQPPYLSLELIEFLNSKGIKHLLLDLPSIDAENDQEMIGHHTFFKENDNWLTEKTITEMNYIADKNISGLCLLQMQVLNIDSDASPSNPIIYLPI
ncbi:MAG: cyclase family protein [Bacteroidota bacterium]|nr:cyclase family protein [Bacteroidota bacterium]